MTIFESIKQMQRFTNLANLSTSVATLASMKSVITQQFNQINGMNELLVGMPKNVFQQLDNLTIKSQLEQMNKIGKLFEAYNSPAIKMQLENLQAISQTTLSAISQSVTAFDFSDIQFNDNGSLIYEGVEYSQEAIEEEVHLQLQEAESNPNSLKESADKLKEKYWLIGLIISLLLFLPKLPQTIDFYGDIITQVYQAINEVNPVYYVIEERAYLREESNAKSKIVATLIYDTALEVLDTIPRWFYVKYIDDEGIEQIGWISKISVKM